MEEWDRQIDINIKGVLYGVAAVLPQMQKQKSGHIINIASVFGIKVFAPGGTVYCATKAAVRALTEGLRMELHSENIRCTMISPGAVESELKNGTSDPSSAAFVKFKKIAIPADSVARAMLYAIEQPADVEIDEVVLRPPRRTSEGDEDRNNCKSRGRHSSNRGCRRPSPSQGG